MPPDHIVSIRVLVVLLSLDAGSPPPSGVPRPSRSPGDFWTYRTNTTLATEFNLTGEATSTMVRSPAVLLGGTAVQADRTVLDGAGTAEGHMTTGNGTVAVTGRWTLRYAMSGAESVTAPAGTFLAFPITEIWQDGSAERTFYAAEVGNSVGTESYGTDRALVAISVLTAYRYQATEPATFLGLAVSEWALVLPVVAIACVVTGFVWRRSRRKRNQRPQAESRPPSPPEVTSGPRGP